MKHRPAAAMTASEFQRLVPMDDAARVRLEAYADLLLRWQRRINLIGRGTVDDLWRRHFLDSAQLLTLLPDPLGPLVDVGSGAGFPGLVLAVLGVADVCLVESDQRKAAFLGEALRVTGTAARLAAQRVEDLDPLPVRTVTARACVPLSRLLAMIAPLVGPETTCLLHKGRDVDIELTETSKSWNMRVERYPSLSDSEGVVLAVTELSPRQGNA